MDEQEERNADSLPKQPSDSISAAESASDAPEDAATSPPGCTDEAVLEAAPSAVVPTLAETAPSPFTPEHERYLIARGVDLALAARAGLHGVDGAEAARLVGRSRPFACGGLAIPYPQIAPPYVRVRLDDPGCAGGMRYVVPAGRPVPLYVPEGLPTIEPLVIVESPIKALALLSAGIAAVGLGGTGTTLAAKAGARELHESWRLVPPIGKAVVVLFDSNRQTNVNVARDEARLALAAARAGGQVKVAALPRAADGADWGPDDFLAALGKNALAKVLEEALPADPAEHARAHLEHSAPLEEGTAHEHAAQLLADLPFLISILERGAAARSAVEGVMRKHKIPIRGLDLALKETSAHIAEQHRKATEDRKGAKPPGSIGDEYEIIDGCLCEVSAGRDGEPIVRPLCNFTANIVREVVRDDGVEARREFVVRGRLADGTPLGETVLLAEDFAEGVWVLEAWGSRALVRAEGSIPHRLRAAIQKHSCPTVLEVYGHTGWRLIGEELVFLHGGGAIGGTGITVELADTLARYRLPTEVEDLASAVRQSLRCLELAPPEVTFPIFGAVYRAPTMSILHTDTTLWIHGRSGAMKSSVATVFLGHFGDFDYLHSPACWSDTAATLEYRLYLAKDVLMLIDDFVPRGADCYDEQHKKAGQILHAIGNNASRGRMRADSTAQPGRPPRALAMVTAEDKPTGFSTNARLLPVHLLDGVVNVPLVTELQAKKERLTHAMAGYIAWLRERYTGLHEKLKVRQVYWRDRFMAVGVHKRLPTGQSHLMVGLELFAAFARDVGVFGRESARDFLGRGEDALLLVGNEHSQAAHEGDPARRFLDVVATLLAQGKVSLAAPADPLDQEAGCEAIGWRDDAEHIAYFLPEAVFRVAVTALKAAGEAMPLQMPTLWERLAQIGALAAREGGRYAVKRVLGGERRRVLAVRLAALEPEDDPGPPAGGGPGAGGSEGPEPLEIAASPKPEASAPAPTDTSTVSCHCVNSPAAFAQLMERMSRAELVAVDTETRPRRQDLPLDGRSRKYHSLTASLNEAIGLSFSFRLAESPPEGEHYYLPLRHQGAEDQLTIDEVRAPLERFFRNEEIVKLFHNAKFDLNVLRRDGFVLAGLPHDTLMLASLVDLYQLPRVDAPSAGDIRKERYTRERPPLGLKELASRHLDVRAAADARALDAWRAREAGRLRCKKNDITYDQVPIPLMTPYAASDTRFTLALAPLLHGIVDEAGAKLYQTERALIPILADMEYGGARIDRAFLERAAIEYEEKTRAARQAVHAAAGRDDFEIDSNPQLVRVFQAAGLHLPAGAGGHPSLTKDTLEALAGKHPLAKAVAEYRKVAKLKSTYIDSLLAKLDERDHVHCNFKSHGTRTGRLSSEAVNLQNIPVAMRAAFVPPAGHLIVCIDLSQIELRIVAHYSQDPVLVDAFQRGQDIHTRTAVEVFGESSDPDEAKRRRKIAKNLNFAICYGAGAGRLAAMSGESMAACKAHLARFDRVYARLAAWKREVIAEAHRSGQVQNLYGRTRWLPILADRSMRGTPAYWKAERCSVNTLIQGTAADMFKETMVTMGALLRERGARTRMVLNVHDELVFYVPTGELELVPELKRVMESPSIAAELLVPLVADVSWSEVNWRDKREGLPTEALLDATVSVVPTELELEEPAEGDSAEDEGEERGAA